MTQDQNTKINIAIISITVLTFFGIIMLAQYNSSSPSDIQSVNADIFSVNEQAFDFGAISMAEGEVKHIFSVENISNEEVIVKKIYTSCMCTTANLITEEKKFGPFGMAGHGIIPKINVSVLPSSQFSIEAIFDPAAHGPAGIGPIQRTIYIETSKGVAELEFMALVKP